MGNATIDHITRRPKSEMNSGESSGQQATAGDLSYPLVQGIIPLVPIQRKMVDLVLCAVADEGSFFLLCGALFLPCDYEQSTEVII